MDAVADEAEETLYEILGVEEDASEVSIAEQCAAFLSICSTASLTAWTISSLRRCHHSAAHHSAAADRPPPTQTRVARWWSDAESLLVCAQAELRKAYRREALKWHPDKSDAPKDEAEVQTRMLTYAPPTPPDGRHHHAQPYGTRPHQHHAILTPLTAPPHDPPPPPRSTPSTRREKPAQSTPPRCVPPPPAL